MLLLPREHILFEHLDVDFVDFRKFVAHMGEQRFSGYIHYHSTHEEALILFKSGNMPGIYYRYGTQTVVGQRAFIKAINEIDQSDRLHSPSEHAVVDLCELSPDKISPLYTLFHNEPVQVGLESELVELPALIHTLHQKTFTGCVRCAQNDRVIACILLNEGELLGGYHLSNRQISTDLSPIIALIEKTDCLIDIYRAKA
ncbi:MAG: hypothetical protein D6675_11100 [Gemmatimonadetes bacterium]|nr:MAG: hypothetical protein D6675_11100 [Gemmatimonadota bacterium]